MLVFPTDVVSLKFPCPTVPIAGTRAECVHESLDTADQVKDFQKEAKKMMAAASLGVEVDGCDGAFSNVRCETWRQEYPLEDDGAEKRVVELCGNHGCHISEVLVEGFLSKHDDGPNRPNFVQMAASFISLLRCGGFFIRLLSSIFPLVLERLHLVPDTRPDPQVHRLLGYIREHSLYFFEKYKRAYSETRTGERALEMLQEAWDSFGFWWNGRHDMEDTYFHHVLLSKMSVNDKTTIAQKMSWSLARLLLRSIPGRPEAGKWTKTPPALDFINALGLQKGFLKLLLEAAGQAIQVKVEQFDGDWTKLSYAESSAVRLQHSKSMVADEKCMFRIKLASLCYNATRDIHAFSSLPLVRSSRPSGCRSSSITSTRTSA